MYTPKTGKPCFCKRGIERDNCPHCEGTGAIVPLHEAEKAFRFAILKRSTGWKRNGETFRIGDFQLDAIKDFGVIAGCHRVEWSEIERFAKAQGWI